jgi:hypothetical protein
MYEQQSLPSPFTDCWPLAVQFPPLDEPPELEPAPEDEPDPEPIKPPMIPARPPRLPPEPPINPPRMPPSPPLEPPEAPLPLVVPLTPLPLMMPLTVPELEEVVAVWPPLLEEAAATAAVAVAPVALLVVVPVVRRLVVLPTLLEVVAPVPAAVVAVAVPEPAAATQAPFESVPFWEQQSPMLPLSITAPLGTQQTLPWAGVSWQTATVSQQVAPVAQACQVSMQAPSPVVAVLPPDPPVVAWPGAHASSVKSAGPRAFRMERCAVFMLETPADARKAEAITCKNLAHATAQWRRGLM